MAALMFSKRIPVSLLVVSGLLLRSWFCLRYNISLCDLWQSLPNRISAFLPVWRFYFSVPTRMLYNGFPISFGSFWWKKTTTHMKESRPAPPRNPPQISGRQLFREGLSEKVHATILKGIVGGFEFTVLQRNLKEWYERPGTYVCEC